MSDETTGTCTACGEPDGRIRGDFELPLCDECAGKREQRAPRTSASQSDGMLRRNIPGVDSTGKPPEGGEPWWWRPFRPMYDEAGAAYVGQPAPPIHVPHSPPKIRGKGRSLGSSSAIVAGDTIRHGLAKLTDPQRETLMLKLQGLSYAAIADRLRIDLSTVRERLRRSRARMKRRSTRMKRRSK